MYDQTHTRTNQSSRGGSRERERCQVPGPGGGGRISTATTQKHLYLVMDDWDYGYSIHKLDVGALESDAGRVDHSEPRRLPGPSLLRVEAPERRSTAVVAALGSKIFVLADSFIDEDPILVYDTATASLAVGPRPTPALHGFMLVAAIGQRLYALNPRRGDQQCSFEVISLVPRGEEDAHLPMSRRADWWSVESVPAPMPFHRHELLTAYAVHPDGRTIFVSARNRNAIYGTRKEGTWSFDTRRAAWTWHGEWLLPFRDQGFYVDELGAWVGLRRDDGFLCSCAVPSRGGAAARPEWKLGKTTMFREEPERHVGQPGATLTYMGNSRFSLVECAARQGVTMDDATNGVADGCVLHVTIFGLEYDKGGELQTTVQQPSRSYLVSRCSGSFPAHTFWR